ncbi:hypothetical protein Lpp48_09117, partial [Lacticaseibacillus paracasei subsp. paracasei Lpp48]
DDVLALFGKAQAEKRLKIKLKKPRKGSGRTRKADKQAEFKAEKRPGTAIYRSGHCLPNRDCPHLHG